MKCTAHFALPFAVLVQELEESWLGLHLITHIV